MARVEFSALCPALFGLRIETFDINNAVSSILLDSQRFYIVSIFRERFRESIVVPVAIPVGKYVSVGSKCRAGALTRQPWNWH
jgi:hypothetical protein